MPADTEDSSTGIILEAIFVGGHLEMDFKEVAKAFGIARSDNAGTKFQTQLKKWGYKYDRGSGKLLKLDGNLGQAGPATPKKRKAADSNTSSVTKGSHEKKQKMKQVLDDGDEYRSLVSDNVKPEE